MAIRRFSSRTERLDTEFLAKSLQGATKYFRIAGYFRKLLHARECGDSGGSQRTTLFAWKGRFNPLSRR